MSAARRVLVVDDEPFNVEYLDQELTDRGYEVAKAFDGLQALAEVAASPPDLILLDVLMPGLDGIEVCRRLKDDPATRLIPIVIMTALTDTEDRVRGLEAGADDFLTKPVDERELFARIRNALRTKVAIDGTVHQLRSATEQITRLGKHDEDIAVVMTRAAGPEWSTWSEVAREHGGIAAQTGAAAAAIFRGAEPQERARAAVDAALAIDPSGHGLGVALGPALIGVDPGDQKGFDDWSIAVDGPVVDDALAAAAAADPGQVVVTAALAEHLGSRFELAPVGADADGPFLVVTAGAPADGDAGHDLAFPDEFAALLPVLEREWGIVDLYVLKTLSGKSGARVLMVDISCDDFSGLAILKLEEPEDDPADAELEAARHARAIARDERYAARHLPRLLRFTVHGDTTATLSTVAAGGLEYCTAWFRVAYDEQLASAERISHDILEGWNSDYRLEPRLVTPSEMLRRWLAHRLVPGVGRLDLVLTDLLGVDPDEPSLQLGGRWYPNPVVFARATEELATQPPLRGALGQLHGDLHGDNVLTSYRRADVSDYFLIDLAFYEDESYLFFDHGYFELSYLLHTREHVRLSRWLELLDGVYGDNPTNADDIGIIDVIEAVRRGQRRWIAEHEEHRTGYMESQVLLGRVAAGLNYANKRMAPGRKLRSFLFAAAALKDYLGLQRIEWPRDGAVAKLD